MNHKRLFAYISICLIGLLLSLSQGAPVADATGTWNGSTGSWHEDFH
jgi:hypothetical protein